MIIQNPGAEKLQKGNQEHFSCLEKNRVPDMGEKWSGKNRVQELLDSVFFTSFPPHAWDSVFFRAAKLASALDYPSTTFQHQCWGWSNLGLAQAPTWAMVGAYMGYGRRQW